MNIPKRNDGLWQPICAYCVEKYQPMTNDGIALCGFCRHQQTKILTRLQTMAGVLHASLVDAIERLSDVDSERYTMYYLAQMSCTEGKFEAFKIKRAKTIAAGGDFAECLALRIKVEAAQMRYDTIRLLFEAIP